MAYVGGNIVPIAILLLPIAILRHTLECSSIAYYIPYKPTAST